MSISELIAPQLPYLRRFARVLSGSQASGDAYVVAMLEAIAAEPKMFPADLEPRVATYRTFLKVWNSVRLNHQTVDAATSRVVGATRFLNVEFWAWPPGSPLQRGEDVPDVVEIGATWLAPDAQRTAINTEAKLLMLTHAFEVWRVHRVSLVTDSRNMRSRNAILRLGARFDGVLRGARVAFDGVIRHTAAYSILESEWPEVKAGLEAKLSR